MNNPALKTSTCIVCESTNLSLLLHIDSFPLYYGPLPKNYNNTVESYPLRIAICEDCTLVQQIDRVNESVMNRVYEADYYNIPSPASTGIGASEFLKFQSFFNNLNLPKGKLLEIGCFDGYLLQEFQQAGFDVYGIDPSNITAQILNNYPSGKIKNTFFDAHSFPGEKFDIIIFRNLLEHIYNPAAFLELVKMKLKQNGHIFVDVPNLKSLQEVGGLGSFFHQHISYFSIDSIRNLLKMQSFEIIAYHEGSPNLFLCAKIEAPDISKKQASSVNKSIHGIANQIQEKMGKALNVFDKNDKVILFGASLMCTTIINLLDENMTKKVKYIFDNDKPKHNQYISHCDTPIQAPKKIDEKDYDVIFILTWIFSDEITKQLIEMGFDSKKILSIHKL